MNGPDPAADARNLAEAGALYLQNGDYAEAARLLKAAGRMANRAAFRLAQTHHAKGERVR
jgi:hypothetical protein